MESTSACVSISSSKSTSLSQPRSVTCSASSVQPFPTSSTPTPVTPAPPAEKDQLLPYASHTWRWRGHKINYVTAGCGPPVLLVHGFGASVGHWKKNIPVLAEAGYKVYALDLLGFGASDKAYLPKGYSMEVWRDLVLDFMKEFVDKPVVLMGNSLGSLTCLMVSSAAPAGAIAGTVLLNAAGAMNNKGVVGDWRILAVYPLLLLIDFLLSIPALSGYLFNSFRTKDNLRQVLGRVYVNQEAVDEALVDLLYGPSCDPGAREVFVSVVTGPPGPKPWEVMPTIPGPMLVLWGDKDVFTPPDGPVGKYLQNLPSVRPNTTFQFLTDVGHCLHDDRPEVVHAALLPWLARVQGKAA
ncbi:MAG: hypothetical protein WDW38_003821 [Sanguina aurantia]